MKSCIRKCKTANGTVEVQIECKDKSRRDGFEHVVFAYDKAESELLAAETGRWMNETQTHMSSLEVALPASPVISIATLDLSSKLLIDAISCVSAILCFSEMNDPMFRKFVIARTV